MVDSSGGAVYKERILGALAASAFLIFFNAYMVAPLIPALAREFSVTAFQMGWIVPAYLLPYGISTLVYGALSDRWGRRNMLLALMAVTVITTFLVSRVESLRSLMAVRLLSGIGSGGVVTIGLAIVGDLYPFAKLGRALGWMFGAIAGGMAFGSTLGVWLNPIIGWRKEFIALAIANAGVLIFLFSVRRHLAGPVKNPVPLNDLLRGYGLLLRMPRGTKAYAYIFMNGLFHGGIFAWLGFFLEQRYHLSDAGIGKALLGYGVPGIFLGPIIGRLADRYGRRHIIPYGFLVAALCALAFIPVGPLWAVVLLIPCLSIGLDMSHPLLAGIITSLDPRRRGQAIGMNTFFLFIGIGLGSVFFQALMLRGLATAFAVFGIVQGALGLLAFSIFNAERPSL